MKKFARIKLIGLVIFIVPFVFMSCGVADSEKEWGISLIYMPQSVLHSGGANNNYYVPSGDNPDSQNYQIDEDNDIINVVLGVYRSGLEELESYSVDVVVRPDTANQLMNDGTISDAELLPEDTYEIPSNVTVSSGERESVFYLEIDRAKLLEDYSEFADDNKKLVLAVAIQNPTKYELNESLSTTIVILSEEWPTLENTEFQYD